MNECDVLPRKFDRPLHSPIPPVGYAQFPPQAACRAAQCNSQNGSILQVPHIGNATRPAPAPIVIRGKAYLKNRTIIGFQANALIRVNYATGYAEARSPSDIPSDRRECCDFAE